MVKRWILARLRNRTFFSLAELNHAIRELLADAILDRIVHNAYRLELDGESLRKQQQKSDADAPA